MLNKALAGFAAIIMAAGLMSCGGISSRHQACGDTLELSDARLLRISFPKGYTLAEIADPWHKGRLLASYALMERGDSGNVELPSGVIPLYVPLKRSIVATSAHCNLIATLGARQAIAGVCDGQYILERRLRRLIDSGEIANCGSTFSPNIEKIVAIGADAMLVSPYEDSQSAMLSARTGIPMMECADYMEPTPLGRAEWMRLYGRLYGRAKEADSLFAAVKSRYEELRSMAATALDRPKVLTEAVYQSVWYCPGGRSTKSQIIADAGGVYAFSGDNQAGSLPLAPEKVVAEASDADVWTFTSSAVPTMRQFASAYRGYSMIKAFRTGRLYVCPSMDVPYFDEAAFRPDWHLKEYIAIIHPEMLPDYKLRYYRLCENK